MAPERSRERRSGAAVRTGIYNKVVTISDELKKERKQRWIEQLQAFFLRHDRVPRHGELRPSNDLPSPDALVSNWGSVGEAFAAAGLRSRPRRPYRTWTRQQLVHELLIAHEELGRYPLAIDFVPSHARNQGNRAMREWWKRRRRPHLRSFIDHFGSYNEAMRQAGFPTQERIGASRYPGARRPLRAEVRHDFGVQEPDRAAATGDRVAEGSLPAGDAPPAGPLPPRQPLRDRTRRAGVRTVRVGHGQGGELREPPEPVGQEPD
jgi:hypothetical protein